MNYKAIHQENSENLIECLGCTSFRWYFPDGKAHQLGTKQHPHTKEQWEEKFDKKFLDLETRLIDHAHELKAFIRHTLKKQAEELLLVIEQEKNKKALLESIKKYL